MESNKIISISDKLVIEYQKLIKLYHNTQANNNTEKMRLFIPQAYLRVCYFLLDQIAEKPNHKDFGFSINYYSEQFRDRLTLKVNGKDVKTFVFIDEPHESKSVKKY